MYPRSIRQHLRQANDKRSNGSSSAADDATKQNEWMKWYNAHTARIRQEMLHPALCLSRDDTTSI